MNIRNFNSHVSHQMTAQRGVWKPVFTFNRLRHDQIKIKFVYKLTRTTIVTRSESPESSVSEKECMRFDRLL